MYRPNADLTIINILKKGIVRGNFTLHCGEQSSWVLDVLKVIDDLYTNSVLVTNTFPGLNPRLNKKAIVFGIEFGGAILAQRLFNVPGILRKDNTVYVPKYYNRGTDIVFLLDDVVTTGVSIRSGLSALKNNNIPVHQIITILDRRPIEQRNELSIQSLCSWEDLMESRL